MAIAGRKSDQYNHRFENGMKDRLKAEAAANNRSITSEINARLEASFETPRNIHPQLAKLIDQHIDQEVNARLRAIASRIGGSIV